MEIKPKLVDGVPMGSPLCPQAQVVSVYTFKCGISNLICSDNYGPYICKPCVQALVMRAQAADEFPGV